MTLALPLERSVALERLEGGLLLRLAGKPHELGPDGALRATLWHRSPAGKWVAVTLPEQAADMKEVQLALRDADHVWLAVNSGDHHALYSTAAALQAAPANPPG